ncbi:hydroxyneurosporene methyltransferase [Raphidocelis subcapitata]|uniref:Hydroxyneurosporene methyltransferase n=1 Tax=Raphidocelis subcapitata TaxID=307507 RepID=A0A2V0PNE6_9CHLO|nr:hydroxyneurosporene methyltransferase [Raphidocelis subcapitata]|eukprot:GBF98937.1 hydroxyneurosporene methyltransferase [Raphidocelis subcapitata]
MIAVPEPVFWAAAAYIAASGLLLAGLAVLAAPALVITRRRSRYFEDWNEALHAPWFFWHVGGFLFRIQELLGNYVLPAPQRVCDLAHSHFRAQVLFTINELGVPDLLRKHGPMSGAALAAATGAHREYLERVLRAASRMGLVTMAHGAERSSSEQQQQEQQQQQQQQHEEEGKGQREAKAGKKGKQQQQRVEEEEEGRREPEQAAAAARQQQARRRRGPLDLEGAVFGLTQLSAVLCEDHPNCVAAMVSLFSDHCGPASELLEGVRSGRTPYELWSGGRSHWDHMAAEPELLARFNRAMTQFNSLSPVEAVFTACPALVDGSAPRIVDVGGGLGAFVGAALARQRRARGALFDMPRVAAAAKKAWRADPGKRELMARVTFHGGSFFDAGAVPRAEADGEIYVLREILHDWSDADSIRILREVRAAIGARARCRLLIVEAVLASAMRSTASARVNGDIHMLVQYGDAKERTEAQFCGLLEASGFEMRRVVPTKGLFLVVEAVPV